MSDQQLKLELRKSWRGDMGESKMRLAWKEAFCLGVWGMCRGDYKAGLLSRIRPEVGLGPDHKSWKPAEAD